MKNLLKNVNILNMLLLILAIFLYFKLDGFFVNESSFSFPKSKNIPIENEEKAANESIANFLDYGIITEKNLFHPLRKILSEIKEDQQVAAPDIVLYGTLITDDKKIAYIEDRKSPYSTPGRGPRQVAVNEGAMIAGYKLEKINADSISLLRGENKITITLSTGKERKQSEVAIQTPLSGSKPDLTSRQSIPPVQVQTRSKPYMPPLPPLPRKSTINSK
ncbi:MAG: hypothetical protein APR62_09755 [Smithella sp. SDB]|nr:MAG: hypothetical protein APR62_09755 [Smithella sp. SDB]